jgi:DNA repair protein RecO (recombination protein O)
MERVQLQPAYILHHYPWRDSSRLLEAFTRPFGRVGLIARGARRPNSRLKAALQPFQPLLLSWTGRGELQTLTGAESIAVPAVLRGRRLLCGFYVNELLVRLVYRHDPHPNLFDDYARCLLDLEQGASEHVALRLFEKRLLMACGYGLNLITDIESGEPIRADRYYDYLLEQGPRECETPTEGSAFSGASLIALQTDTLEDEQALKDARRLLRAALDLYIGEKPMKTRQVLREMARRG